MSRVNVISPAGAQANVDESELEAALADGYTQASPEEIRQFGLQEDYGDTGSQIRAGVEGFGRGLTAGGTDWVANKVFDVPYEDIQGRKEANPVTATTGDVLGVAAPLLATLGGSAPVSGGGLVLRSVLRGTPAALSEAGGQMVARATTELLGEGVVRSLLPKVAAGAVSTGFYGAARTIAEDQIDGDDPSHQLTAEKFFSSVGKDVLLGGGVAGLAGIAGSLLKKGTSIAEKSALKLADSDSLAGSAENWALRSFGPNAAELRGLKHQGRTQNVARAILDSGVLDDGTELGGVVDRLGGLAENESNTIHNITLSLDDLANAKRAEAAGSAFKPSEGMSDFVPGRSGATGPGPGPAEEVASSPFGGTSAVTEAEQNFRGVRRPRPEELMAPGLPAPEGQFELPAVGLPGVTSIEKFKPLTLKTLRDIIERDRPLTGAVSEGAENASSSSAGDVIDLHPNTLKDIARAADKANALTKNVKTAEKYLVRPSEIADRIERELVAPNRGKPALQGVAESMQSEADKWRGLAEKQIDDSSGMYGRLKKNFMSFGEAQGQKQAYDEFLNFDKEMTPQKEYIKRVRGIVNDEIEKKAEAFAKDIGDENIYGAFKQAKDTFRNYRTALDIGERTVDARDLRLRSLSPSDHGVGIGLGLAGGLLTGSAPVTLAIGAASGLGNKFLRERGPALIARFLNNQAKDPGFLHIARGFQKSIQGLDPASFGRFGRVLSDAAEKGPLELMGVHTALAQSSPDYEQQMGQAGFGSMDPETSQMALSRAGGIAAAQSLGGEVNSRLDAGIDRFVNRTRGTGERLPGTMTKSLFLEHAENLRGLLQDSNLVMERIDPGGALTSVSPQLAAQLSSQALKAFQFLESKLPARPEPSILPGQDPPYAPTGDAIAKYSRYHRAVASPLSVLEDMRKGAVSRETVEAIQTVYPNMAQDMTARIVGAIHDSGRRLTYQQMAQLSALMGQPLTPSLGKSFVAGFQAVYQQAGQQAQQAAPTRGKIKMPSTKTLSQQLEAQGE